METERRNRIQSTGCFFYTRIDSTKFLSMPTFKISFERKKLNYLFSVLEFEKNHLEYSKHPTIEQEKWR